MIIVTATLNVHPESLQEVLRSAWSTAGDRDSSRGACSIPSTRARRNANQLVFLEHWVDIDALKAHFAVPASPDFAKSVRALGEPSPLGIFRAEPVDL